jgi:type VI secretion system protein ImpL
VSECTLIVGNRYPFFRDSTVDVPLVDFGRLFGHGGVYDAFFKKELADFADTSKSPWQWRTDVSGEAVGGSAAMLRQFEAAQAIRDMFFRSASQDPELRFTATPFALDTGAQRVTLEIDGQTATYFHAAPRDVLMTWPGPKPGTAAVTFEERSGRGANIVREGAWAWFRLMDAAQIQPETEIRYVATFAQGGHEARVTLAAPSIRNPYAKNHLQTFRCG